MMRIMVLAYVIRNSSHVDIKVTRGNVMPADCRLGHESVAEPWFSQAIASKPLEVSRDRV